VLNTIVSRASQLAGADGCSIYEYDEEVEQFRLRAAHNTVRRSSRRPARCRSGRVRGSWDRAVQTREPVQIPDIAVPGVYQSRLRDF